MRIRNLKEAKAQEQLLREELLKNGIRYTATALAVDTGQAPPPRDLLPSRSPFEAMLGRRLAKLDGRYRGLLETAPDAIIIINAQGNIVLINAQAEKQFGYDRDELVKQPVSQLIPLGLMERILPGGGEDPVVALKRLAGVGLELIGHRKDNSDFPIEVMLSPLESADGLLITASVRNISAHKAAERRLALLEARYRDLLDAAPDAMVVINKRGKITLLNKQAENYFGYNRDELLGRQVTDIIPTGLSDLLSPDGQTVIDAVEKISGQCLELTAVAKDGSEFPIELMLSSLQSTEGVFVTAAIRHIGDRRAREQQLERRESRYRALLEAAPYPMVVVDQSARIVLVNALAEKLFGYRRAGELVGHAVSDIVPVGLTERLSDDEMVLTEGELLKELGTGIELFGRRANGQSFRLEVMLSRLNDADEPLVTVALRDLTVRRSESPPLALPAAAADAPDRANIEDALFSEHERAQVTLNAIADAVACVDRHGHITFLNRVAQQMTGWPLADAMGKPLDEIVRIVDATTRQPVLTPLQRTMTTGETAAPGLNRLLVRRDGGETPIEDSVAAIHDRSGTQSGAVVVFRDVRAARTMAMEMAHSARHDFLTGLPNRMLFNDRVAQAITVAPRHGKKVAVLFIDLDGFKHVNDTRGHPVGDKLLQSIAKRLVACVRAADTVCRQGGDEFVVLLSEVERAEDPAILAGRILHAISEPHDVDGHKLQVSASIGVAVFPDDADDAETLIKNADMAMYHAKDSGRNGYHFFTPVLNERAAERQMMELGLRRALEHSEFKLFYQPKVNLRTGEISGAEALLRWSTENRNPISPADFLPVAESSGLIQPIGEWVLREACRQTKAWLDAGLRLPRIAVNISAFQFRNDRFLDTVFAALDESRLDPRYLELELNEGALMKQVETTDATLAALRNRGVRVTVDDFGTGYSNLSNLRRFPIDALKIDRSFVQQIGTHGQDGSLVATVLNMARSLNLRCVAEGVETAQELAFLQANQCDNAQGYYFSRPLPPQQFATLLQTGLLNAMAARRQGVPIAGDLAATG